MVEYVMARDPEYRHAMDRVSAALQTVQDVLIPRDCKHGSWAECEDDCTWAESWPKPGFFVDQWALVVSTECMTPDGDPGELDVHAPADLRMHSIRGLLETGADHLRSAY